MAPKRVIEANEAQKVQPFKTVDELPHGKNGNKFLLSGQRKYGVSAHFSANSAKQFPDDKNAGFGILVRAYYEGEDGKLKKSKGFTKPKSDDKDEAGPSSNFTPTPEVGIYLRWAEYENLVKMHHLLKTEAKSQKKAAVEKMEKKEDQEKPKKLKISE